MKRTLPCCQHDVDQLRRNLGGAALVVEQPDIDVVRAERLQAGFQVFHRFLPLESRGLGRNVQLVPPALDGSPSSRSLLPPW